jgi:uridine kinase
MDPEEHTMKIIAIGAVTAGGKTTVVNAIKDRLPRTTSLHFDDYSFDGEPDDFTIWVSKAEEFYNVWDLSPLKADVERIINSKKYDYLLLDYPFAYQNKMMKDYLDCCIFIDTPLDIAMARRVLRDMKEASADDIRNEMDTYLNAARVCYVQMLTDILPNSDYVIDGANDLETIINETMEIILRC